MYAFSNNNQVLVVISTTFVLRKLVVAVDVSQCFKYMPANSTLLFSTNNFMSQSTSVSLLGLIVYIA